MSLPRDAADAAPADEDEGDGEGDPAVMRRASWTQGKRLDVGLCQLGYTSPLPSPDDLDRYAAHLPDAPERLLAAGEREQAHRHEIERRLAAMDEGALPRFFAGERFAHAVSLLLGLAYLSAMVLAILQGYPLAGVGGATFGVAAVIWAVRRDPSSAVEAAEGESAPARSTPDVS